MTKLSVVLYLLLIFVNFNSIAADCSSYLDRYVPTSRFVIHHNGTFTDKVTGLMWSRCFAGMIWVNDKCEGDWLESNLEESIKQANHSVYAGFTDWRIPNTNEILTIIEYSCYPAVNDDLIKFLPPTTHIQVWTNTFVDDEATWGVGAYMVSLNYGAGLNEWGATSEMFSLHVRGGDKI
ncbi:MAG: DUF1566 domain-containing protein [Colwellia sp.]|nr:DUF1566 domain-containing protein [Colwellia sp.]